MFKSIFPKNKKTENIHELSAEEKAAQDWMPIYDIHNEIAFRRDQELVTAIKVQPVNIHLLSEKEQRVKISALHEVLNGIDVAHQFFSVAKPVDLDAYISELELYKEDASFRKTRILDHYIQVAAAKASSGTALERLFFVVLSRKRETNAEMLLYEQAKSIASNLTSAGLTADVCTEQELRDLYFITTHPAQASVERSPLDNILLPPIYEGGAS